MIICRQKVKCQVIGFDMEEETSRDVSRFEASSKIRTCLFIQIIEWYG